MNYTQKLLAERLINKVLMNAYSVNCLELLILQKISNNPTSTLFRKMNCTVVVSQTQSPHILKLDLLFSCQFSFIRRQYFGKADILYTLYEWEIFLFYVHILFW
jgi:hypothetical protein